MPFVPGKHGWANSNSVNNVTAPGGATDGTIADVGASFNQATLNKNFREVQVTLNTILQALRDANIIAG